MTEPDVASSDATNIATRIERDGDDYVINGRKWWTSGAGDPRCKICIFMGQTDPDAPTAPAAVDDPGAAATRPASRSSGCCTVFGYDDAPHGHAEVIFDNVRVPAANMLLGEGRGFEIAQGRLGPGPHPPLHAADRPGRARARSDVPARCERASPSASRSPSRRSTQERIADSRIEIEQARLLTLKAAYMMDTVGNKAARAEIAMIKVVAPNMACG